MRYLGSKHSIIIGLVFELLQLFMLGFGSQPWYVDFGCAGTTQILAPIV
jgi:hypothetical protein